MDLSKAFDTFNQNIKQDKLHLYGFGGVSQFTNYLSNRKLVSYNSTLSSSEFVKCGVPRRSTLGPLPFIVYTNDICHTSKLLSYILYADDTTIFYSNSYLNSLYDTVNCELNVRIQQNSYSISHYAAL